MTKKLRSSRKQQPAQPGGNAESHGKRSVVPDWDQGHAEERQFQLLSERRFPQDAQIYLGERSTLGSANYFSANGGSSGDAAIAS